MAQVAFLLLALLHLAKATDYDYNYDEYDDEPTPPMTPVKIQFLVEPLTLTVNEGDMIRLPCLVDQFDQFPRGLQLLMWKKDSNVFAIGKLVMFRRLFLESVNNGNILHIPNATPADEGEYTCEVAAGPQFVSGTPKDLVHRVKVRATSTTGGLAPLLALLACDCLSLAIAMATG